MLGVSAFVENVFPPIPGDTITAFGAFLVGTQRLSFVGVYVATTLGSLIGFMFLFWVGGLLGRRFFIERDYRFFRARDIMRAEEWFQKYGYFLILMNRFFPGIRSVISIAGGISQLKILRVTLLALASALIWNLIWIALGYSVGTNWNIVKEKMAQILLNYNIAIVVVLAHSSGCRAQNWAHPSGGGVTSKARTWEIGSGPAITGSASIALAPNAAIIKTVLDFPSVREPVTVGIPVVRVRSGKKLPQIVQSVLIGICLPIISLQGIQTCCHY